MVDRHTSDNGSNVAVGLQGKERKSMCCFRLNNLWQHTDYLVITLCAG